MIPVLQITAFVLAILILLACGAILFISATAL